MTFLVLFLLVLKFFGVIFSTGNCLKIIPDDTLTTCDGKVLQEGEVFRGKLFDANASFILENDNHVRIIGGVTMKVKIDGKPYLAVKGFTN